MSHQKSRGHVLRLLIAAIPLGIGATAATRFATPVVRPGPAVPLVHPLFEKIVLSPDQRFRIDSIRAAFGAEAHAMLQTVGPSMAALGEARARHDTAEIRRAMEAAAPQREKVNALLTRERTSLREVLTSEQQSVFDRNLTALSAREAKGRAGLR
jgi:Spy/CpxP family protein refolding chaperone